MWLNAYMHPLFQILNQVCIYAYMQSKNRTPLELNFFAFIVLHWTCSNKVEEKANGEYKCKTYKVERLTSLPLFFMHTCRSAANQNINLLYGKSTPYFVLKVLLENHRIRIQQSLGAHQITK